MATLVHTFQPLLVVTEDTETGRMTARFDFFDSQTDSAEVNGDRRVTREIFLDEEEAQAAAKVLDDYLARHPALTATVVLRHTKEV